jgi:hypothetical protein
MAMTQWWGAMLETCARRMLAEALQAEVDAYIARFADERDEAELRCAAALVERGQAADAMELLDHCVYEFESQDDHFTFVFALYWRAAAEFSPVRARPVGYAGAPVVATALSPARRPVACRC